MFVLANKDTASDSEIVSALTASRSLTADEIKLLKTEIDSDPEGRKYSGAKDSDLITLLCTQYQKLNPEPQGRVPKQSVLGDWIKGFLFQKLTALQAKDQAVFGKWAQQVGFLATFITQEVLISDAAYKDSIGGYVAQAIGDGVFTQQEWEALTTDPDPNWQAIFTLDARASSVLNLRFVYLDLADIAAIRSA